MIKQRNIRIGMALLLAGSMSGCAGWGSSNQANLNDSTEARLVEAQQSLDDSKNPGGINGAFSDAKQAVSDAFTIEPRVIKAPDPLALSNQPNEIGADVFLTAGAFFETQGQLDRAKQQYERALQNDPNQIMALVSLARLTDRMGNSVEAEAIYGRALAAHPDSALVHNDLGLYHARKGQPEKAAVELEQAARFDGSNLRYGNNYATVLVELGQYEQAFAQLSTTSSPAEAHYNLGFLLHRNDQPQLARQHFAEAARLNPNLQQAHAMLARLAAEEQQQAQAYHAANQYQAAPAQQPGASPAMHQPQWSPAPGGDTSPASQQYQPQGERGQPASYTAGRPSVQQLPPVNQR
jgi:Tfp pilus assembly protein PilF